MLILKEGSRRLRHKGHNLDEPLGNPNVGLKVLFWDQVQFVVQLPFLATKKATGQLKGNWAIKLIALHFNCLYFS